MNEDDFDRSAADPEILRDYKDMRNERRASTYLLPMALGGKVLFLLTLIVLMMGLDELSGYTKFYILVGVTGFYLLICLTLMVTWSQSGKRLRTLGIIVGFLFGVAVLATIVQLLMFAVLS